MKLYLLILFISLPYLSLQLDNGLGLTPQMGWNSWNHFACEINETLIKATADAMVSTGLAAKGYIYLNLDDCWQAMNRSAKGYLEPNATRFPSGFNSLANYIHSKGLKFGVYSDAGTNTCQDRPGSLNHEQVDAQTFANWTVDYLKYDNCHNEEISPKTRYPPMTKALNETGRPIFFSMCEWGESEPWKWAAQYSNSWRIFLDIKDFWEETLVILDLDFTLSDDAAPGGWNDPDMLEVGNGALSTVEYQAQFALWAILKAPLIIGCDVRTMDNATLNILANEEVIAINQDKLGKQGKVVSTSVGFLGLLQVITCELEGNATAVAFFNRGLRKEKMKINFSVTGYKYSKASVRDVINRQNLGIMSDSISIEVDSHQVQMVKLSPISEQIFE